MAFAIEINKVFVVDPSGGEKDSFKTIQDAINASPILTTNDKWNCIRIKKGIYRERVSIEGHKPWTYLEGAGMGDTHVVWDGTEPFNESATLGTRAHDILVKGISFTNSYNSVGSKNNRKQASAAKIEGDRSAFFDCGFFGLQDTLWDDKGKHYFHNCTIEGAVDFICGAGQSIYEKCRISVVAERLNGSVGCIAAHSRGNPNEYTGYVFKYCTITGNGKTYLGRPWFEYARVLFYKTSMSDIIVPEGWHASDNAKGSREGQLTFEEIECTGLGAAKDGRVKWANKPLSKTELDGFLSLQKYINEKGWIPRRQLN